mgnify:CR=1 FL=1
MAGEVLQLEDIIQVDRIAMSIAQKWQEWSSFRVEWLKEKEELQLSMLNLKHRLEQALFNIHESFREANKLRIEL